MIQYMDKVPRCTVVALSSGIRIVFLYVKGGIGNVAQSVCRRPRQTALSWYSK